MDIEMVPITKDWTLYKMKNNRGIELDILNYGGIMTRLIVPDRTGHKENIILGYENVLDYGDNPHYLGAIIGRVAGRVANAQVTIDQIDYLLDSDKPSRQLHGGKEGLHQILFTAVPFQEHDRVGVRLKHISPDGSAGYPGTVDFTITYTLTNSNQITIDYFAVSDQTTVLTLTNHTYFNLSGNLKQTIDMHDVKFSSKHFLERGPDALPTGQLVPVAGTPFDFNLGRRLKNVLASAHEQLKMANGIDHYYIFDNDRTIFLHEAMSGRWMTIETSQPGFVLYTANHLPDDLKLSHGLSKKHLGICIETQAPPASLINSQLPSIFLNADTPYSEQTTFHFSTTY